VSVPWVTTMPSTHGLRAARWRGGELEPDGVVHVLAADGGDLLAGDSRHLVHAGRGGDQGLNGETPGLVAGVSLVWLGAGDGAAGGEDDDVGQLLGGGGAGDEGDEDEG